MKAITTYAFRPKRKLFYMNPSKEEIASFYQGVVPEKVEKYNGAFGTYGYPGLFMVKRDGVSLCVIGIEYRPDDSRIPYPEDLEEILLEGTFFRSDVIIDDEDTSNNEAILKHVEDVCSGEKKPHYYMEGQVTICSEPDTVQVFMANGHCRVLICADYTRSRKKVLQAQDESDYEYLYYHDTTTNFYNWNYIWPRMCGFNFYGVQDYAFVYFDIKDFNAVNVVYGHLVADDLLTFITKQMAKLDWVYYCARTDNDNFAMMIKDMSNEETTEKLLEFFDSVSHLEQDENYRVYYRCGVVPMRTTIEMGGLVADAGKQAQSFGTTPFKTEVIFFTEDMREAQERSIRLRTYLDTAIEKDEFMVYLQPKYDINSEKVVGAEALIRWMYKGQSMMSPGVFVPIFEAGGLIGKLDDIVLNKVCAKIKEWEKQGKELHPISVNVSRKSVGIPGLLEHLTEIVDSYGVDHSLIDFELTESAAYENQEMMIKVITGLKDAGFKTSMDDFGTGYSSLSLLPIMPFGTLKIDKSFVDGIGVNDDCQKSCSVVKQVIVLAKELKLTCLAEGAETKEQVALLKQFGCEVVQGYYYSKPLPMEEYEKLL